MNVANRPGHGLGSSVGRHARVFKGLSSHVLYRLIAAAKQAQSAKKATLKGTHGVTKGKIRTSVTFHR